MTHESWEIRDAGFIFPYKILQPNVSGSFRKSYLEAMKEILEYYQIYEEGVAIEINTQDKDYTPSDMPYLQARMIVDKQARFMFSKPPDLKIVDPLGKKEKRVKDILSEYQTFLSAVMLENSISSKLLKAAKDCFIGKRVACIVNVNEETKAVSVQFFPSFAFVHETDPDNDDILSKISVVYSIEVERSTEYPDGLQVFKKTYEMIDGVCCVTEKTYDSSNQEIETLLEEEPTRYTYIPGAVILNDGLTGDTEGVSEIKYLKDGEKWYTKLANGDIDANRMSMNAITYVIDMDPTSTKKENLHNAPGSFWDLQSSPEKSEEGGQGKVGRLEGSMNHSGPLDTTLSRIKTTMYDMIDMPDIHSMEARLASGKALKALYWGLIVRCDEKWLSWSPKLAHICRAVIDAALLYPEVVGRYTSEFSNTKIEYEVQPENQYALPEDEEAEQSIDLAKVAAHSMSRKTFIKKWGNLTDDEADNELTQIAKEKQLLEGSYLPPTGVPARTEPAIEEPEETVVEETIEEELGE